MPLDGLFLHHLTNELTVLNGGKISKIYQISDNEFLFIIRNHYTNYQLLISTHPEYARIHLTDKTYEKPDTATGFTMFLRKHLEGGILKSIQQLENDRILEFNITNYNELEEKTSKKMYLEFMGRYSNMIITENEKVLSAVKLNPNIDESSRLIISGANYEAPVSKSKINPYTLSEEKITQIFTQYLGNELEIYLSSHLQGVAKKTIQDLVNSPDRIHYFYNLLHGPINPVVIKSSKKDDFYFIPYYNTLYSFEKKESLNQLLDDFYYSRDSKEKISQRTKQVYSFIEKRIDTLEKKIIKLNQEYAEAKDCESIKHLGDLLYANLYLIPKHANEIKVIDYENNEEISIPLNPLLDANKNAQSYYSKYKKKKNAISHLEEQIQLAKDELEYFNLLENQIKIASINDSIEIQEELINNGYMKQSKLIKGKRNKKPNLLTYIDSDGVKISVGKNNIQNDYLTHKLAKPNEVWFHVQNSPSSHVVVHSEEALSETTIRTAAMITAFYSKYRGSSSVPIDYTKVKYIKKIPGKKNCFVTYTHQSTIYIDPSIDFIEALKQIK